MKQYLTLSQADFLDLADRTTHFKKTLNGDQIFCLESAIFRGAYFKYEKSHLNEIRELWIEYQRKNKADREIIDSVFG